MTFDSVQTIAKIPFVHWSLLLYSVITTTLYMSPSTILSVLKPTNSSTQYLITYRTVLSRWKEEFVWSTAKRLQINRCVLIILSTLITRLTFWFIFSIVPLLLLRVAWLHHTHLFHSISSQCYSTSSQSRSASTISCLALDLELNALCGISCSVSTPSPLQFCLR